MRFRLHEESDEQWLGKQLPYKEQDYKSCIITSLNPGGGESPLDSILYFFYALAVGIFTFFLTTITCNAGSRCCWMFWWREGGWVAEDARKDEREEREGAGRRTELNVKDEYGSPKSLVTATCGSRSWSSKCEYMYATWRVGSKEVLSNRESGAEEERLVVRETRIFLLSISRTISTLSRSHYLEHLLEACLTTTLPIPSFDPTQSRIRSLTRTGRSWMWVQQQPPKKRNKDEKQRDDEESF